MTTTLDKKHLRICSEFMQAISQKARQHSVCFQGNCQLNRSEFTLIYVLKQHGSMFMKDISTHLVDISLSTLTRLIDRLEAEDYVKRSTEPSDRRCFMISLTDKAEALMESYPKQMDQLAADMLQSLTSEEQQTLTRLIEKMSPKVTNNNGGVSNESGINAM